MQLLALRARLVQVLESRSGHSTVEDKAAEADATDALHGQKMKARKTWWKSERQRIFPTLKRV